MADDLSGLPPEYAAKLAEILRRQQFAQQMQTQAFSPKPTEMVSGIAVKNGGLNPLLQALTGYLANNEVSQGAKQVAGVKQEFNQDQEKALREMQNLPSLEEQIRYGQTAGLKYPVVGALAKSLTEKKLKLLEAGSKVLQEVDPKAALGMLQNEKLPGSEYQLPTPKEPSFSSVVGPNGAQIPTVTNYNMRGVPTASFGPGPAASMQVTLPGKEAENVITSREAEIKTRKEGFDAAKTAFLDSQRAVEALQGGAQAGGGEALSQWMRKAYQFLGGNPKNLTETTNLQQAIGGQILENARKLAPVTEIDLKQLENILGSVDTDPSALEKGLAYVASKTFKYMHDFHSYLGEQTDNAARTADPVTKSALQTMMAGVGVGREAPDRLFGPTTFQLELARNLSKQGYDLQKLQGLPKEFLADLAKAGPDGIRVGMDGSFPTNQKKLAVPLAPEKDPAKMTAAEKAAEIARLKKLLGHQ